MKRLIILMIFFKIFTGIQAVSEEYPSWSGFPPMYTINDIIEYKGCVYCTTIGGIFRYEPLTQEYKLYYKNQGLVSNDVLCIAASSDKIFLGFKEDGLWQFDPDNEEFRQLLFPEYHAKTSTNPNGIAVNDIFVKSDSILYVGHDNGVDMLNLYTEELRTYTNLGPGIGENMPVTEVKNFDGRIWACTTMGLAVAEEDDPNLEFEENWKNYTYEAQNIVFGITSVLPVERPGKDVYVGSNRGGIFILDEKSDKIQPTASPLAEINMMAESMGEYWAASSIGLLTKFANLWKLEDDLYTDIVALAEGEDGRLWVGTKYNGLQCYTDSGYVEITPPNEMKNKTFYDIDIGPDGVIWAATTWRDSNMKSTFQRLEGNEWCAYEIDDWKYTNMVVSTLVDSRGLVWTGLWGTVLSGAYVIEDDGYSYKTNDKIIPVDDKKEILRPTAGNLYIVCSDLAEDRHGNVWVANYQEDPPDHKLEPEPTSGAVVLDGFPINRYRHYSPANDGLPTAVIFCMCTDDDGWVWLGTYRRGVTGIYVGDDPFDKSYEIHEITKLEHGLNDNTIQAVICDLDGFVWVGTNAGLNRIAKESGHSLTVENMNEALGGADREVKAIEVDRFNNKWIGTSGGLVKINTENKPVELYTTKNSGLFSDAILSLKYDNREDVLWIGTGAGLNKFDVFGEKISGGIKDFHVYPNPFEIWGYDSSAEFPGLKAGSTIQIYSFTGDLVNELAADKDSMNGGVSVTWDGRNYKGNYVGSGIYFFTGIDSHGHKFKDKMVVIRR